MAHRVISVETSGGEVDVQNCKRLPQECACLGSVLTKLGLAAGTRAALAWNNRTGKPRILLWQFGCRLHCPYLNPRLHPDQMVYIANDAQDRVIVS